MNRILVGPKAWADAYDAHECIGFGWSFDGVPQ